MTKMEISQGPQVKAAKCVNGARTDYNVKGEPGLQLRVTAGKPGGDPVKSWSLLYRSKVDGRQKRWTIGRFPDWSLKEARDEAQRLRQLVKQGSDPALERDGDVLTFAQLGELFIENYAKQNKKSWAEDQRMMTAYLLPVLGARPAQKIVKPEVRDMLDALAKRAPIQANRVLSLVRKVFNWAEKEGYLPGELEPGARPRPAGVGSRPGAGDGGQGALDRLELPEHP